MSYTPPSGGAITASWVGASAYTPLAGGAITASWTAGAGAETPVCVATAPAVLSGAAVQVVAVPIGVFGHVRAPSPLGAPAVSAWHDFTDVLGDVISHYVMDLDTPSGTVRVPISSWQATLQAGLSSYVQCVIPAATAYTAAIESATAFTVRRRAVSPSGLAVEYPMATAPAQTVRFDRGPQRNTCTLSGYTPASAPIGEAPPPALYDRELVGVRSISSGAGGVRVRCAIDWTLRPGHRAFVEGAPFVVSYINYYVTGGDAYADVGERT